MLARALSCAMVGLDSALVEVEVDLSQGLPAYNIVGLPDTVVNEAKERVRAAIRNSGLQFPMRRITVNLAPADLRKEGPAYSFLYPCRFLALAVCRREACSSWFSHCGRAIVRLKPASRLQNDPQVRYLSENTLSPTNC